MNEQNQHGQLLHYDVARSALEKAHSVDEVKAIRDKAEALRVYARQASDTSIQNWAVEIKLRAERRAGELIREQQALGVLDAGRGGDRKSDHRREVATLKSLDITRDQSSRWQRLAAIPGGTFERIIASVLDKNKELTSAAVALEVRRLAQRTKAEAHFRANVGNGNGFGSEGCGNRIGPFRCCTCICGDAETLLSQLPQRSISAIVTDPPYGVDAESWDEKVPYQLLPRFLELADAGPVLWFGAAPAIADAYRSFNPEPERMLIWAPRFTLSHTMANGIAYRFHPIYAWNIPKEHGGPSWDVLDAPTECGRTWWKHRGAKPIVLMEQLVGFVPEGQLILDPFAGSGSTLVAAKKRNRHFLGFEKSRHYCDVILSRLWQPETALVEASAGARLN